MRIQSVGILGGVVAGVSQAFYLSAWSPEPYDSGKPVTLWLNKASSDNTQIPYSYAGFDFVCSEDDRNMRLNLGELLRGDRIVESKYKIAALKSETCAEVCKMQLTDSMIDKLKYLVKEDYRVEWILDNLPSGTPIDGYNDNKIHYNVGFHLGEMMGSGSDEEFRYFNHHKFVVRYQKHPAKQDAILITGFEVYPHSLSSSEECNGKKKLDFDKASKFYLHKSAEVKYTYSVQWVEDSGIDWGHRWDRYIDSSAPQIHWYSIVNSLMLVVFLSVIAAIVILRTLNRDISQYNESHFEDQEEVLGWKLVHGDVFRPPKNLMVLTTFIGSGVQLFTAMFFAAVFSILGILNPSYRGGLLQFTVFFFAFSGLNGGYVGSRIFKSFNGVSWKTNAFWTSMVFPLAIFTVLCILNTLNWVKGSSNALPAGTFVALMAIWFLISLPLIFLGSYFGFKKQPIEHPVRTNQIPRQIPEQSTALHTIPSIIIGGMMPFAVVFMELFFIIKSIWADQYYYMFGFLALTFVVLTITCIEITFVMIYFQLCSEDYRWHWKSFLISSSSTWYIIAFCVYYYWRQLAGVQKGFAAGMLFFGNILFAVAAYFLTSGTIGFLSTYYIMRKIYGAVKID